MDPTARPFVPSAIKSLLEDFRKIEEEYRATSFAQRLSQHLAGRLLDIDRVVVLGLGPFYQDDRCLKRSRYQLAFIRHVAEIIKSQTGVEIPIHSVEDGHNLREHFLREWEAFQSEIGIKWIRHTIFPGDLGSTHDQMTPNTLLYGPCCPFFVLHQYLENKDPGFYIGTFLRDEIANGPFARLREEDGDDKIEPTEEELVREKEFEAKHDWELLPPFESETHDWELLPPFKSKTQGFGRDVLGARCMYTRKERWREGNSGNQTCCKKRRQHALDDDISTKNSSKS